MKNNKTSSNKKNDIFFIDKTIFLKKIEPLYKNYNYEIDSLLEFEINLPFQLPFANDSLYCFNHDKYILHFFYKQKEEQNPFYKHKNFKDYYTSVTVGISYNSKVFKNKDISIFFDIALKELNSKIIAYIIYTKDNTCFYLTKEMLSPFIIINLINLKEISCDKKVLILHNKTLYKKKVLSYKDLDNIFRLHTVHTYNLNPLIRSQSYVLKAKRNLREGLYDDAIISIQIYIEIIIRLIYKEVLISLDKSMQEIKDILEKTSFINLVTRELQKHLGGSWDKTKEGTKINSWYINTYNIRNKIVHNGYYPNFNEVTLAIDSAMKFSDFIFNQIRKNKTKYPKLNSYFTNNFK